MLPTDNDHIDFVALHYIPSDAPDSYAPVKIIVDGNCFPRTLSYLLFKDEDHHQELCTQIVYEASLHKGRYLDNNYIQFGANHHYNRSRMVEQFAQYTDNYVPGQQLHVEQFYESEVLDIAKDNAYMGIWQMFQAANVIGYLIRSIYPEQLNENITLDLNRVMYCFHDMQNPSEVLNIMWTPTQVANTRPCHFVPLLFVVRIIIIIIVCRIIVKLQLKSTNN